MRRRRGKITEVSDTLEQVYIEGGGISCQAGIVVSQDGITFYEHSHGPVSHKRYTVLHKINYCDVADMRMADVDEYTDISRVVDPNNPFEPKNCHLLRVFFRRTTSHMKSCEIRTANLSRRHHQLISEWESYLRRESLCLNDMCNESDTRAAERYYHETLNSLHYCTSDNDRIEILNEFAMESMLDFTLKKICFQSREIFMKLFLYYDDLLLPPTDEDYMTYRLENVATFAMTPVSIARSSSSNQSPQHDRIKRQFAEQQILTRLKVAHAIFKVFFCIFFSCDSVYSRFDVITGAFSPMNLKNWVKLVVVDIHKRLCELFHYTYDDSDEDADTRNLRLDNELFRSFSNIDMTTPRLGGMRRNNFDMESVATSFTDEIMTPLRKRVQQQLAFAGLNSRSSTALVSQSIKDLQTLLAFFVCDSAVMGPPARIENVVVIHALPNIKFGDNLTKHSQWTVFVENMMARISDVLDDMLALDSVASRVKNRIRNKVLLRGCERTGRLVSRHRSICEEPAAAPDLATQKMFDMELDRLRVPPSPNKLRSSVAWRDDDLGVTSTTKDESDYWTEFETQEILLHNSCSLVRLLVLDCPKVRTFLTTQMDSYWFGIMHSFNLLFPRPDEDKRNDENAKPAAMKQKLPDSEKEVSFVGKYFASCGFKLDENSKGDEIVAPEVELSISEKNKKYPPLFLTDYGKPAYDHLSDYSWELLLLARRSMEDTVKMLELNVSLVRDQTPIDEEVLLPTEAIGTEGIVQPEYRMPGPDNTPTDKVKPKQSVVGTPHRRKRDEDKRGLSLEIPQKGHSFPGEARVLDLDVDNHPEPFQPRQSPFSPHPAAAMPFGDSKEVILSSPRARSAPSEEKVESVYNDIQTRRRMRGRSELDDSRISAGRHGIATSMTKEERLHPNRDKALPPSLSVCSGPHPAAVVYSVEEYAAAGEYTAAEIVAPVDDTSSTNEWKGDNMASNTSLSRSGTVPLNAPRQSRIATRHDGARSRLSGERSNHASIPEVSTRRSYVGDLSAMSINAKEIYSGPAGRSNSPATIEEKLQQSTRKPPVCRYNSGMRIRKQRYDDDD